MKQINFLTISLGLLILFILFTFQPSLAQTNSDLNNQQDAIAVRIVPNPNHYSIYRWYASQGFKGAPQALTVDGYEAIRDGRTVYVNAANIIPKDKTIFSNIYLISYNQKPNVKTVDILGQIIANWKFNDNLGGSNSTPATCSISASNCSSDADCQSGQTCSKVGLCELNTAKNCSVDNDCPANFFCDSIKAKVIRDLKRVGEIEELKESLSQYKKTNNHYPILSAGTYLTGHTISVWPSWNNVLLPELTTTRNITDPINRLGYCPDFNAQTCWNKDKKTFVYTPTADYLKLPQDSYAFIYSSDTNGADYNLCAVMESRDSSDPLLGYHFSPNDPAANQCVLATGISSNGEIKDTAPRLIDKSLVGESGQEFNGFIRVIDDQNNPLVWKLKNNANTKWIGWSTVPILKDTNDPNNKKIYAKRAGNPGTYNITLSVNDGQGKILLVNLPIIIKNQAPFIEADNIDYIINPLLPLDYTFNIFDTSIGSSKVPDYGLGILSGPFNLLAGKYIKQAGSFAGINKYKVNYTGIIPTTTKFTKDTDFSYRISAADEYGAKSKKTFTIRVKTTKPLLDINCASRVRVGALYSCKLGSLKQGNFHIAYFSNALPLGLKIKTKMNLLQNKNISAFLVGAPSEVSSGKNIVIAAVNDYGTKNTASFTLKINSYCGDGIKESPNSELRGGIYNNGYEDCDGSDGVSTKVSNSKDVQYGCTTEVGVATPGLITGNDYCVFKSPIDGGGYCGDGFCQTNVETKNNCVQDCDPNCTPSCNNRECGDNGCNGFCGSCGDEQTCNDGKCTVACPAGTYSLNNNCVDCGSANNYCPGDENKYSVSIGYYSIGRNAITRSGQAQCPINTYCSAGIKYNCSNNKVSPAGSDNISDCVCAKNICLGAECGVDSCGDSCGECPRNLVCSKNRFCTVPSYEPLPAR